MQCFQFKTVTLRTRNTAVEPWFSNNLWLHLVLKTIPHNLACLLIVDIRQWISVVMIPDRELVWSSANDPGDPIKFTWGDKKEILFSAKVSVPLQLEDPNNQVTRLEWFFHQVKLRIRRRLKFRGGTVGRNYRGMIKSRRGIFPPPNRGGAGDMGVARKTLGIPIFPQVLS